MGPRGDRGRRTEGADLTRTARNGLRDREARDAGFDRFTTGIATWDHISYYSEPRRLQVRVMGDRQRCRLLGVEILGPWRAVVAMRIDAPAAALYHGVAVDGLGDLDLSYTPPVGHPWEAAPAWEARRVA